MIYLTSGFLTFTCLFVVLIRSDNVKDKYPTCKTRQSKLLHFNYDKNDEINVELEFNVPFLGIPIKKSMDSAKGAIANLNLGAVALVGIMAASATVIIPAAYYLIKKKQHSGHLKGHIKGYPEEPEQDRFRISVKSDNVTDKYLSGKFETRQSKLLNFNFQQDDAINVALEFTIPFMGFPVKQIMDSGKGVITNLNVGAVALAGVMTISAAIILPAIYHLINKKQNGGGKFGTKPQETAQDRYRNNADTSQLWRIMDNIDQALSQNNIDSTSCIQRAICWNVKSSNNNMLNGQATSTDKIIDGLATNDWVRYFIDGSVFRAAVDSGLRDDNCSEVYSQCKFDQSALQVFAKKFIKSIYY